MKKVLLYVSSKETLLYQKICLIESQIWNIQLEFPKYIYSKINKSI